MNSINNTFVFSGYSGYSEFLDKVASEYLNTDIAFNKDQIPLSQSLSLLKADPYLSLKQKNISSVIFEGAENSKSGLISGKSVMRSALGIGATGGAGYLFGKAVSTIFSLPPTVTRRLSGAGAIAGALIGTGIFTNFGE